MSFVSDEILGRLGRMERQDADAQSYGVVKVDDKGVIQMYNKWESELAGIPPAAAEGKNFFTQVAPCTNNRLVFGRFKKGIEAGELNFEMKYTFTYKMKPTNVKLHLYRDPSSQSNWVFVQA